MLRQLWSCSRLLLQRHILTTVESHTYSSVVLEKIGIIQSQKSGFAIMLSLQSDLLKCYSKLRSVHQNAIFTLLGEYKCFFSILTFSQTKIPLTRTHLSYSLHSLFLLFLSTVAVAPHTAAPTTHPHTSPHALHYPPPCLCPLAASPSTSSVAPASPPPPSILSNAIAILDRASVAATIDPPQHPRRPPHGRHRTSTVAVARRGGAKEVARQGERRAVSREGDRDSDATPGHCSPPDHRRSLERGRGERESGEGMTGGARVKGILVRKKLKLGKNIYIYLKERK